MSCENLDTYLNDHLAGAVGALELLDHLIEFYKGSDFEAFLSALRKDIEADQRTLQELTHDLGFKESEVRKAGAWVGEKLSRLKLRLGTAEDGMGLFLALEGITLGISGKKALWKALAAAAQTSPKLRGLDYDRLEARAEEQFERVEAKRLEVAVQALPT